LLSLQREVIGVISAKMLGFGIEGVGFAISTNTVNMYLPRLEAGETITSLTSIAETNKNKIYGLEKLSEPGKEKGNSKPTGILPPKVNQLIS